jgi:hypothetical protein
MYKMEDAMSRPTDPVRYFVKNYRFYVCSRGDKTEKEIQEVIAQHKNLMADGMTAKEASKFIQREVADKKSFAKRGMPCNVQREISGRYFLHLMKDGKRYSTTYATYEEMISNYKQWRDDNS